jgi:hypothetical protein
VLPSWGHVALGVVDLDATFGRLARHGITPDAEPIVCATAGPRLCLITEAVAGHLFELVEVIPNVVS